MDWSTCDLRDRSAATRLRTRGASTAEAQRPYAGRWSVASSDMWLLKTWSDPRESRQLGRATRGASQLGSVISVALRDVGSAWTGSWGVDPRHPSPVALSDRRVRRVLHQMGMDDSDIRRAERKAAHNAATTGGARTCTCRWREGGCVFARGSHRGTHVKSGQSVLAAISYLSVAPAMC